MNAKKMTLVCEDSFDGILTAVYDGFLYKGCSVKIIINSEYNYDLFSEYVNIVTDYEKSRKVLNTIREKISDEAFFDIFRIAASNESDKCDLIFEYIIKGLRYGREVSLMLTDNHIMRCQEVCRKVNNETLFYREILRFEELPGKILFARISPRSNVMYDIMEHFSDRFPEENFFIYDDNRRICGVHNMRSEYYIINDVDIEELIKKHNERLSTSVTKESKDIYTDLWRAFFKSISIKERENYKCQRNHLPLHYRKHITEFK